jgi:hypothetical protein
MRISKILSRIGSAYTALCIIAVNVLIIAVLLNVWAKDQLSTDTPFSSTQNAVAENWIERYGIKTLRQVYVGKSDAEIREVLNNTAVLPVTWYPWVLFKSAPVIKPYYAVHEEGFRFVGADQGPWPPDSENYNVFFFGGSTTYGAGVPDVETIPAYFQEMLQAKAQGRSPKVYNFGTGAYIFTQEMIRFQELIWRGFIPDAVVFLDGLNDFQLWDGTPAHADRYVQIFNNNEFANQQSIDYFLYWTVRSLPIKRWIENQLASAKLSHLSLDSISSNHASETQSTATRGYSACRAMQDELDRKHADYHDPQKIETVITRYTNNAKIIDAIADAHGIDAYLVWQPIPTYNYDRCFTPFHGDLGEHYRSRFGYPVMAEHVKERPMPEGFVWCADIQRDLKENLYVDHVHYNAKMNRMIAACIFEKMRVHKMN